MIAKISWFEFYTKDFSLGDATDSCKDSMVIEASTKKSGGIFWPLDEDDDEVGLVDIREGAGNEVKARTPPPRDQGMKQRQERRSEVAIDDVKAEERSREGEEGEGLLL